MREKNESPLERPNASRALAETRQASRCFFDPLGPGRRMEIAFRISMDAWKLHVAGLKMQGFSDAEVSAMRGAKRR